MENIVNLNEDEIFKTLQICHILKGNHMGVLCLGTFNTEAYMKLKQFSNTIHTLVATAYKNNIPLVGYDYYGNVPSEYVLKDILTEEMPEYKVIKSKRTIRKESSFLPMLNFLYPKLNIGEMNLGNGFTYSEPYVKYNGNIVCIWKPLHQEVVSEKNFSFENKSLIYTYKKPIYILTADAKRHLATEFEGTPKRMFTSFICYFTATLIIDVHHWYKAWQTSLPGKEIAEIIIKKTQKPCNKVYCIMIRDNNPKFSSFCVPTNEDQFGK